MQKIINDKRYFLLVSVVTGLLCLLNFPAVFSSNLQETIYTLTLGFSYGFMYQLPTLLLFLLPDRWIKVRMISMVAVSSLVIAFLFADARLYGLYGFHFNGFVWNLLTTPGGSAALGADQTNILSFLVPIVTLVLVQTLCVTLAFFAKNATLKWRWIVSVFLVLTITERLIFGVSFARIYSPILSQSEYIYLHQPFKMNSFLQSVGIDIKKQSRVNLKIAKSDLLNYPLKPLTISKTEKPFNILMLVAESLRAQDIANERVMPHTLAFSKREAINFKQHYSGGNGTRQGLFSLFYGLYGNYWDVFLRNRRSPVLFEVLDHYQYDYFIYTSASFTYPEFDQTIFARVPPEKLIADNLGEPWKRDERNITRLLKSISNRNQSKPFMGFMFFEATHARYSFPENSVIEKDYLKTFDYGKLSRETIKRDITGMKARYFNSAHFIDSQLRRVYDYLTKHNLLDNTVVIVTGDHGEEFMEKGRWGHNSAFTEEQLIVPMIVHFPGELPREVTTITSHMDVIKTLVTRLGVTTPPKEYTLGNDLLTIDNAQNEMAVVSSWSDLGIITPEGKLVIPFKGTTQHENIATTQDDQPVAAGHLIKKFQTEISDIIKKSQRFR